MEGLSIIVNCVVKIRESVKYVKWSESRKRSFQNAVKLARISETKTLWLDVPTRWNSTYMMLDRAILHRNAFKELCVVDCMYKHFPEREEWEIIKSIRDILEPFNDITNLFSGSNYPTSNLYFENVWRVAMLLKELVKSNNNQLRTMAMDMKVKFDKYWANSCDDYYTMLFSFVVVLDSRCKVSLLKYCYKSLFENEMEAILKMSDVIFRLGTLLKEYSRNTSGNSSDTSHTNIHFLGTSGNRKRGFDFLAGYDIEEEMLGSNEKKKLDFYLEDSKEDRKKELDVLQFWQDNEYRYGELSLLARDILNVPLTTVASESTFSIGGRILHKWRSSYIPENVEALITTRSWLYGYELISEDDFTSSFVDWASTKHYDIGRI